MAPSPLFSFGKGPMPTITKILEFDYGVQYKPVPGYPGYLVGNDGTVWTKWGKGSRIKINRQAKEWKKLTLCPGDICGHLSVQLHNKSGHVFRYVHRLVLELFVGPCPPGLIACHAPDRSPANNKQSNLRWGTYSDNEKDKIPHGVANRGERHWRAKLTNQKVRLIRVLYASGKWLIRELAEMFKVGNGIISMVINRKIWRHI